MKYYKARARYGRLRHVVEPEAQAAASGTDPAEDVSALPEWAQARLSALQAKVAAGEAEATTLQGQVNALTAEKEQLEGTVATSAQQLQAETLGRTRDRLALERGIPLEVAALVNGDDEAALTAAFDAVAALRAPADSTDEKSPLVPNAAQQGLPAVDERQAAADAFFSTIDN